MAVGDWHMYSDGRRFQETLHGPLHWGVCVDCGKRAAEALQNVGKTVPGVPDTRCEACWKAVHGIKRI